MKSDGKVAQKWSQLPDLDVVPDSDARKIRVFPLKDKKNLPKFVTIFYYSQVLSLTVSLTVDLQNSCGF